MPTISSVRSCGCACPGQRGLRGGAVAAGVAGGLHKRRGQWCARRVVRVRWSMERGSSPGVSCRCRWVQQWWHQSRGWLSRRWVGYACCRELGLSVVRLLFQRARVWACSLWRFGEGCVGLSSCWGGSDRVWSAGYSCPCLDSRGWDARARGLCRVLHSRGWVCSAWCTVLGMTVLGRPSGACV